MADQKYETPLEGYNHMQWWKGLGPNLAANVPPADVIRRPAAQKTHNDPRGIGPGQRLSTAERLPKPSASVRNSTRTFPASPPITQSDRGLGNANANESFTSAASTVMWDYLMGPQLRADQRYERDLQEYERKRQEYEQTVRGNKLLEAIVPIPKPPKHLQVGIVSYPGNIASRTTVPVLKQLRRFFAQNRPVRAAFSFWDKFYAGEKWAQHHIYPQESKLAEWFRTMKIDIHQYTVRIPRKLHIVLHDDWNRLWEQFLGEHGGSLPAIKDVEEFGELMLKRWGIWELPKEVFKR